MKRVLFIALLIILLLFVSCDVDYSATSSVLDSSCSTSSLDESGSDVKHKPEHSQYYIEGLSVEDLVLFFNEVCLEAEIVNSGDPSRLQKWESSIYYKIYGSFTDEDILVLTEFASWLNSIYGFPGIYIATNEETSNLSINFCSQNELLKIMGSNFDSVDGAVTFWYDNDVIHDAVICYRTDISQVLRNSVILEEIYNGLGPINDTVLREDSVIYSEYSEQQSLTEVDKLILKLLYHPKMVCGMNAEECEQVIRSLYY